MPFRGSQGISQGVLRSEGARTLRDTVSSAGGAAGEQGPEVGTFLPRAR